ncbi:hypothetical protein POSPLADRAFT_1042865 [Postia placenta MAD-698-R-SB12]|uniref:Uncharacterized protein n=1 Tax=Postia placenta MAD-698-R-SB12 TaxID=670580 RepID=A0A1X6NGB7_9APHY|nr:hypothetical protein POSPLADRAFT_1042865 [Postia placenta MAD-698-R-SB12]OSX67669.1 hypothetical protein POSPLADRAFT_1042865 [Postia placenta MAD-698-R-SB12]
MLTDLREIATIDHAPGRNSNRPLDHYNSGGALKVSMKGASVKLKKEECTPCPPTCNEEGYVVGSPTAALWVQCSSSQKRHYWRWQAGTGNNHRSLQCSRTHTGFRNVYLYADAMSAPTKSRLRVAPVSNQEISGLLWGRDASSSMLFASTMTRYEQDFLGYHRAYDATTRQIVCEYKIDEAGEQLAVEESGRWYMSTLAAQTELMFLLRSRYKTHHLDKAVQTRTQPMVV